MAFSSASTAALPTIHADRYDVFLGHRGPDIKKILASSIYRLLLSHGLRTFLDQQELFAGDDLVYQIESAIATSTVHIAIFSPRYADSRWCLDELHLMLESKGFIIPVFYGVEPSDLLVSTGEGVYAQALLHHEETRRYSSQTLEDWRNALNAVSSISGFDIKTFNGDEGELVDKVVERVLKRVRLAVETYPTRLDEKDTSPTSLDEKLEHFERTMLLQQRHSGEAQVVWIVGLGGVGKTTLAREFFNRKSSNYDKTCFLFDVNEAAGRSSLTFLQGKLYKNLTGGDLLMKSVDHGIEMLRRCRPFYPALVILDNVDHVDQLKALFLPVKDVLSSGSLILVTSRNEDVLTFPEIEEPSIYNMTGLDRQSSEELFCSHAFQLPRPPPAFEEGVIKFLDACEGLPLSLKVFGALLNSDKPDMNSDKRDMKHWQDQLDKLSIVHPAHNIQLKLKMNYDNLTEEQKEIFLDIACFFIGIRKDTAIRIWEGCGWQGYEILRNLEKKCLVEFDSKNRIRMHDHLRDLGRDLADKEEPLGCRRRLWRLSDNPLHDMFQPSSVRGITMVQQRSSESLGKPVKSSSCFVDMSGLQLLRAHGDCLRSLSNMYRQSGPIWLGSNFWNCCLLGLVGLLRAEDGVHRLGIISNRPSQDLLWLCWDNYPYSSLPPWIPIKNLRVLEVAGLSQLETLWDSENEAPLQLRELNIGNLKRLPKSIGLLKHLEKIDMKDTEEPLPQEFFHLHSLKYLRLQTTMNPLPDSLGNLTNLQHIDLSRSKHLQGLPPSFGNLTNLLRIDLNGCCRLQILPDSFGMLTRLEHLSLAGCEELTLSRETFEHIRTLTRLDFSGCQKMEVLPTYVSDQRFLEEMDLSHTSLRELPIDNPNLSNLEILKLHCPLLEMLPRLDCFTSLKELTLSSCPEVKWLPDSVGRLNQLRTLMIDDTGIEDLPAGVMDLNKLEFLSVIRCPLQQVPFSSLKELEREPGALGCMFRLKQLDLHRTCIKEIAFAEGVCPNLRGLDISDCTELLEVRSLPSTLVSLKLKGCVVLKKIRGLPGLAKLHITS